LIDDTIDNQIVDKGHDSGSQTYIRDEITILPWLHGSVGLAYQQIDYADSILGRTFEESRWSPRAGVSVRLTPSTLVRAAAFGQLNINLFGTGIAPPTVSGFVVARNEFATARRNEYSVSFEQSAGRVFVAARAFKRDTLVPYLLSTGGFIPEADASGIGGSVHVNWIVHNRLTVFGDNQFFRFGATRFDRYDNAAKVGVNMIHPRGVFLRVTGSHVTQRFANSRFFGLPRSGFTLADVSVNYEFAGKRGLASLQVTNAFNERFDAVIEGLSIDAFLPRRRALATLRWRLW